ncbi:hypothetical protein RFI_16470, partial [Reticulomyxa filosa]
YRQKDKITIVTQCSLDRLKWISPMCRVWQGPISLAVYIQKEELMSFLKAYDPTLEMRIMSSRRGLNSTTVADSTTTTSEREEESIATTKLVTSLLRTKGKQILTSVVDFWKKIEYGDNATSNTSALDIHLLFETEKSNHVCVQQGRGAVQAMYPVNALRNLALRYVRSDYVFLLDADFVPSHDMHRRAWLQIQKVASQSIRPDRLAFIVPAWEVLDQDSNNEAIVPRTKRDIIAMANAKRAIG